MQPISVNAPIPPSLHRFPVFPFLFSADNLQRDPSSSTRVASLASFIAISSPIGSPFVSSLLRGQDPWHLSRSPYSSVRSVSGHLSRFFLCLRVAVVVFPVSFHHSFYIRSYFPGFGTSQLLKLPDSAPWRWRFPVGLGTKLKPWRHPRNRRAVDLGGLRLRWGRD